MLQAKYHGFYQTIASFEQKFIRGVPSHKSKQTLALRISAKWSNLNNTLGRIMKEPAL